MAGAWIVEMFGAFLSWAFTGFKKSFVDVYKKQNNSSFFTTNFIIGMTGIVGIVLFLYYFI